MSAQYSDTGCLCDGLVQKVALHAQKVSAIYYEVSWPLTSSNYSSLRYLGVQQSDPFTSAIIVRHISVSLRIFINQYRIIYDPFCQF